MKIISYRRVYEGGKSRLEMDFDKDLFLDLRDRIEMIYQESKEIMEAIQSSGFKGK